MMMHGLRAMTMVSLTSGLFACSVGGGGGGKGGDVDGGIEGGAAKCPPSEAVVRTFSVGRPSKADVLFVVDDSGPFCEEQRALTQAFGGFARAFVERLGPSADVRIAVTTPDLQNPTAKGAFREGPTPGVAALNCDDSLTGQRFVPDVEDCDPLLVDPVGDRRLMVGPVLRYGEDANVSDLADLDLKFRCMATAGTLGDGFEKGLEAIRVSLSCNGPNRELLAGCCFEDPGAPGGQRFDPTCPKGEPGFLRPEVPLIVVIASDDPDCSAPADNPPYARDPLCRFDASDLDADGVPDVYSVPEYCPSGNARACFEAACGGADARTCHERRCVIERTSNSNCIWDKDRLTPVSDYADFLREVKGGRSDLVVVVPVVGNRNYLDANSTTPLTFARPSDPPAPESEGEGPEIDLEACCGDGVCESSVTASCASDLGAALTGERYLELADAFPSPGIGCPVGAPANGEPCTTICDADFPSALNAAVSPLGARPFSTCLPATPDCRVGQRPCTDIESRSAERIDSSVQVPTTCPDGAEGCVPDALGPADYIIDREAACATGFEVTLTGTYPPGTRLSITIKPAPAADCL